MSDLGRFISVMLSRVARDETPHGFVSTAEVSDGRNPYETAVQDDRYDHGEHQTMTIVEDYLSRDDAEAGHAKWLALMTGPESALPAEIVDCANSLIGQMCDAMSGPLVARRKILPPPTICPDCATSSGWAGGAACPSCGSGTSSNPDVPND